ncbi:MAG TPA: hypothetical protein VH165_29225 [Kofleriaceae bacterium]|jgi:hypothetical protein|nr:hypothetical protein [Kofleriaceae bacterium]
MRAVPGLPLIVCVAAAVAFGAGATGCSDPDPPGFGYGLPPAPGDGAFCQSDVDCFAGQQCARSNYCFAAGDLRAVHVNWTIGGMPVSSDVCSKYSDLELSFIAIPLGVQYDLTFAPVPCVEGKFTIDKLPKNYDEIALGSTDLGYESGPVDAIGNAYIDLPAP